MSEADDGLRARLDAEINAFKVAATGYVDGELLCVVARGDGGEMCTGLFGWTWGGCDYIEFLRVPAGDGCRGQRRPGPAPARSLPLC